MVARSQGYSQGTSHGIDAEEGWTGIFAYGSSPFNHGDSALLDPVGGRGRSSALMEEKRFFFP